MAHVYGSIYDTLDRGRQLSGKGAYREAVILFDSIISTSNVRKSILFEALDCRARCHKLLGNYSLSLNDYDSALQIDASPLNLAIVALNKSDLLLQTGRYKEAEELLDRVDNINPEIYCRKMSNKASSYMRMERFIDAESIYKSILGYDIDNKQKAVILQNLGFLYMAQGQWMKASDSLSIALSLFNNDSVAKYICLSNLAMADAFNHNVSSAKNNIDSAVYHLTRLLGETHPDVVTAIRKRAEIYLYSGNKGMAALEFKKYFDLHSNNVSAIFGGMTTQSRLDFWKKERPLISLAFGVENEAPGLLFDIALFRRGLAMTGNNSDYNEIMSTKGGSIQKLLHLRDAAVDFIVYPKREEDGRLIDWMGAIVAKRNDISFVSLGRIADFDNYKVNGVSLKIALTSGRTDYIDAIYSDTVLTQKIWSPIIGLLKDVRDLYFVPDGLFNLLAIEYMSGLPADIHMHRLTNLANLSKRRCSSANESFLLIGGLDYDTLADPGSETNNINHMAADFLKENISHMSFYPLPGMKAEVDRIHILMPATTITNEMPEEKFKNDIGKFNKLHISSHGYTLHIQESPQTYIMSDSIVADRSLLASGLVLSGANVAHKYNNRDDGLLSARELCDLDMSGVDFIALSACQTADGRINDEGPAGLVRGLKKAGAGTIIATLWEVNDNAALMFMTKFYELMASGVKKADAFAKAQEHIRNYKEEEPEVIEVFDPAVQSTRVVETDEMCISYPFSAPSMWAPFILIDNIE